MDKIKRKKKKKRKRRNSDEKIDEENHRNDKSKKIRSISSSTVLADYNSSQKLSKGSHTKDKKTHDDSLNALDGKTDKVKKKKKKKKKNKEKTDVIKIVNTMIESSTTVVTDKNSTQTHEKVSKGSHTKKRKRRFSHISENDGGKTEDEIRPKKIRKLDTMTVRPKKIRKSDMMTALNLHPVRGDNEETTESRDKMQMLDEEKAAILPPFGFQGEQRQQTSKDTHCTTKSLTPSKTSQLSQYEQTDNEGHEETNLQSPRKTSKNKETKQQKQSEGESVNAVRTCSNYDNDTIREIHSTLRLYKVFPGKLKKLEDKGITVRMGKWTRQEDHLLLQNVKRYCKENGVNPAKVFTTNMEKGWEDVDKIDFKWEICEGIARPPMYIFERAKRLLDKNNHRGRFTYEEQQILKELQRKFGNDWVNIGKEMNRSKQSVFDKFKDFKEGRVTGKWTSKERKKLKLGVKEVLGLKTVHSAITGIPWKEVAEYVPTRTARQCITEWRQANCWENELRQHWKTEDKIKLIERIYNMSDVWEESSIDWIEVHKHFPHVVTPWQIQTNWYNLKVKTIDGFQFKSFQEILTELYEDVLPKLRQKIKTKGERQGFKSKEFISSESESDSESDSETDSESDSEAGMNFEDAKSSSNSDDKQRHSTSDETLSSKRTTDKMCVASTKIDSPSKSCDTTLKRKRITKEQRSGKKKKSNKDNSSISSDESSNDMNPSKSQGKVSHVEKMKQRSEVKRKDKKKKKVGYQERKAVKRKISEEPYCDGDDAENKNSEEPYCDGDDAESKNSEEPLSDGDDAENKNRHLKKKKKAKQNHKN
ncbi:uncharacterized protein LOC144441301 [Glandiceps talaboti]